MAWVPLAAAAISAAGQAAQGSPAGPSEANPYNGINTGIDFSDWTVATSGSTAEGSKDTTSSMPNWLLFAGMAIAGIVAVKWLRKSK